MLYTIKFLFILIITLLIGCSKSDVLMISGSTTVLPVIAAASQHFSKTKGARVIVNAGGSGVGIHQLGQGHIDIGMISRDITPTEKTQYPGVEFKTYSIGKDAVVPVVSSEVYNAGVTQLTLSQIRKIYQGKTQNWKEVGGPDREIVVIDKERSRGTRHVFMKVVFGDSKANAPGADLVLGSNNEEQTALTQSNAAIGMLSHAWLNDSVKGVSIILNNGVVVAPSLVNIRSGAYPICRDLLLVTPMNPTAEVVDFITYVQGTEGQTFVEELGYVAIN